ncbi:MAG: response regulator transcription factor [Anaerolineae bacterium]|nr:response regulator transcription factor [Anaerolineae bacterium]
MRTLIVDDEAPARERLRRLLAGVEGATLVGEAASGAEAVELIEALSPELVLLDIQMPDLDGFGVIDALEAPPLIIFVTAYDAYAIRAFEVNALDYLLKPFSRARLEEAMHRARAALTDKRAFTDRLRPVLESLTAQGQYLTRLAVHDRDRIRVLDAALVDWIGVEGEGALVHVGGQAYPIRRTLTDLASRLDPSTFFRANRSAIVNLNHVQEVIPWFRGSHRLRLTSGAEVDLSRAQARALRQVLGW